jgi:hypothetical protein
VFLKREFPSYRYFATKFLDERYDKTIALARVQDKELNEFHVFQEAQRDRFSPSPEKPLRKKGGSTTGEPTEGITKTPENTRSLCPFNKNLVISFVHKKFPLVNWSPIERDYRLKMKIVGLYRIGDWVIGYGYTLFVYWFLPALASYLLLKKGVFSKQRDISG